jgi:hypothetical protein
MSQSKARQGNSDRDVLNLSAFHDVNTKQLQSSSHKRSGAGRCLTEQGKAMRKDVFPRCLIQ